MFNFLNFKKKKQNKTWNRLVEGDHVWLIDKRSGNMQRSHITRIEPLFDASFHIVGWKYHLKINRLFEYRIEYVSLSIDDKRYHTTIYTESMLSYIFYSSYKDAIIESKNIKHKIKQAFEDLTSK